jgi:hypothetical protein
MQDGRQIIVAAQTVATLQVYADRIGIKLGTIHEWVFAKPKSME